MNKNTKISVAMSGGVDSGVAGLLLKNEGYDIVGATMRLYIPNDSSVPCNTMQDIADAKKICEMLGIEHRVYEFEDLFYDRVIRDFTQTYIGGGTPNPCIVCNKLMKFGAFLDASISHGADKIATGHYAIIEKDSSGRYLLRKAKDKAKDQTYVLWSLDQFQLSHTLLPLGEYTKEEIRLIAEQNNLINAHKSDSQDICFVPDGDYASFIKREFGYTSEPGNYIDIDGNIIGKHKGIIHYTIGQRKGLGISVGRHIFVKEKNVLNNTVTLADEEHIFTRHVVINNINLIPFDGLDGKMRVEAKIRYSQKACPAVAEQTAHDEITLTFDEPQRAAAAGQSAVMYDDDYVMGGGIIKKAY
ncbi:MAG: tRNA 2-thiouridine(34) synthase MnmA [Ruminococcaceae bacterium]|nr:tRNA 2-thiouridine(34) synthase MnmA [Oscillospiraceae bacterium]